MKITIFEEAKELLVSKGLQETLEKYGSVVPTGSYSLNLMTWRDLDPGEVTQNCINLVPIFIAFVDRNVKVKLSNFEHDQYAWISYEEARDCLVFSNHIETLAFFEDNFIKTGPNEFLRINFYLNISLQIYSGELIWPYVFMKYLQNIFASLIQSQKTN